MNEIETLKADNEQKVEDLRTNGFELDALVMLKLRVDVLTEQLVATNTLNPVLLEQRWETLIGELLDQALGEVARRKLLEA